MYKRYDDFYEKDIPLLDEAALTECLISDIQDMEPMEFIFRVQLILIDKDNDDSECVKKITELYERCGYNCGDRGKLFAKTP